MVINWTELRTFEIKDAEITAPWLLLVETLRDATHLQIKAEGSWTPMGGLVASCGPDGLAGLPLLPERLIVADCPVGALIGKIGGSSASVSAAAATPATSPPISEGKAFAIGSHCVTNIPEGSIGPLFVGFNCLVRPVRVALLKIVVAGATPTT
jgi:hypothetical protein